MSAPGTHRCYGLCGAVVPNRLFACASCWRALPRDLREPVQATAGQSMLTCPGRLQAIQDARRWYREQAMP